MKLASQHLSGDSPVDRERIEPGAQADLGAAPFRVVEKIGWFRSDHRFEAAQKPCIGNGVQIAIVVEDFGVGTDSRSATSCKRTADQLPFCSASMSDVSTIRSRKPSAPPEGGACAANPFCLGLSCCTTLFLAHRENVSTLWNGIRSSRGASAY